MIEKANVSARRRQIQAELRRRAARGEMPTVFGFDPDREENALGDSTAIVVLTFQLNDDAPSSKPAYADWPDRLEGRVTVRAAR